MRPRRLVKFFTLKDGQYYYLNVLDYKTDWNATIASKGQKEVKDFFKKYWSTDCVCEEMKCRPLYSNNYRLDLINIDRRIAVEFNGRGHIKFDKQIHKDIDDFYNAVERDHKKKMWCEKNNIELIEIYPKNLPLTEKWLIERYPSLNWK